MHVPEASNGSLHLRSVTKDLYFAIDGILCLNDRFSLQWNVIKIQDSIVLSAH